MTVATFDLQFLCNLPYMSAKRDQLVTPIGQNIQRRRRRRRRVDYLCVLDVKISYLFDLRDVQSRCSFSSPPLGAAAR